MNTRALTVLPARLTASARFTCRSLRVTLGVSQCAARFGGVSDVDDTCSGCPHGKRTYQAMRGAVDPAEAARNAAAERERHHAKQRTDESTKLQAADDAVLAVITEAGRRGAHSGRIIATCSPKFGPAQVRYALQRLAESDLIVRGERLARGRGGGFIWRAAKAKSEAA